MEINIGISEFDENVDNYYGRNIGSHTALAERLSTVSSPFMVFLYVDYGYSRRNIFLQSALPGLAFIFCREGYSLTQLFYKQNIHFVCF